MAFTLMRGTVHRSLHSFDMEMEAHAKSKEFKDKNGVVVSVIKEESIIYHWTNKSEVRSFQILAFEDGTAEIRFVVSKTYIHSKMPWLQAATYARNALYFLIDGVLPEIEE